MAKVATKAFSMRDMLLSAGPDPSLSTVRVVCDVGAIVGCVPGAPTSNDGMYLVAIAVGAADTETEGMVMTVCATVGDSVGNEEVGNAEGNSEGDGVGLYDGCAVGAYVG